MWITFLRDPNSRHDGALDFLCRHFLLTALSFRSAYLCHTQYFNLFEVLCSLQHHQGFRQVAHLSSRAWLRLDLERSSLHQRFRCAHLLLCRKNTLPRTALPQFSQVRTTRACLRKASNPGATSLPAFGARSIEPASQSRVSASRKSVLIKAPYRAQNLVSDVSVTRGS